MEQTRRPAGRPGTSRTFWTVESLGVFLDRDALGADWSRGVGGVGWGGVGGGVLHVTQAAVSEKGSMQTREGQIHQAKPKPPSPRQPAIKSEINR